MMEFVSWDDEIPNIWKNNPNVPNHQPDINGMIDKCLGIERENHGDSMVIQWNTLGKI